MSGKEGPDFSLRDYFAGQLAKGIAAGLMRQGRGINTVALAKLSYRAADSMLLIRGGDTDMQFDSVELIDDD